MNPWRRPRRTRLWPALCLWACSGSAPAALQLEPIDQSRPPPQAAATRQLLADAVQRLPASWADALDGRIDVEWRDDLPAQVHGRATTRQLLLKRALLDDWMARSYGAGIDDPATRAVLSAVIHELAHFYDRTPQGRLSSDPRLLDLAGWQLTEATGVSANGRTIVGNGINPDGQQEAWIATIPPIGLAGDLNRGYVDPSHCCYPP